MLVIILIAALIKFSCSNNEGTVRFDTSTSDFANLVKTEHFVDKSNFVKVFFQATPMMMITAPRRFGKSTNMDMVKRFCEVTVDENGNREPLNSTTNYKLFTTRNLDIFKHDRVFFSYHFGKYPIIYLDFKELICSSYKTFIGTFKRLIRNAFSSHEYLLNSNKLNEEKKYDFKKFYQERQITNLEDYELYYSAKTLSYLLHTHFGKKCIVLIDECDGPIQKAIFKSCTDLSKIIDFIREFISISLKSNTYVGRALINACIRLGGIITADANNIEHIPFLTDHIFSPFYGFTEEDVKLLLEKLNMSDKLVYVREWYDGYKVENSNISIYNPHSILNYLKSKECNSYWGKSGYVINIERILLKKELRIKMKTLLDNKVISISAADRITVNEILKLKELVNDVDNCTLGYRDIFLFLNFMLDLGYFTVTERKGLDLKLWIPNKEIRTEIKYHVYSMLYFKKKLNVTDKDIKRYVNSINTLGKSEDSYKEFAQSVLNLFSYGEMPKTKKELLKPLVVFPRFSKDLLKVKVNVPIETNKTDKSGVI